MDFDQGSFVFDDNEPLTDLNKDKIVKDLFETKPDVKTEKKKPSHLSQKQQLLISSFTAEDARKLANRASAHSVSISLKAIMTQIFRVAESERVEEQVVIRDMIGQMELDILRSDLKFFVQVISSDNVIISWNRTPIDGCSVASLGKIDRELIHSLEKKQPKLFLTMQTSEIRSAFGVCVLQITSKKPCRDIVFDRIRLVCIHKIQEAAKRKASSSVSLVPFSTFGNILTPIEKMVHFEMLIDDLTKREFNLTEIYRHSPQQLVVSFALAPTVKLVDKMENKTIFNEKKVKDSEQVKKPKFFQNKEAFSSFCQDELKEYTSRVMQRVKEEDSSQDDTLRRLFESILCKMEYAFSAQPKEPAPWKAVVL